VETTFLNLTLAEYSVAIRGHYVVAVEHENYEAFVGSLPFNFEVVIVPETSVSKTFQMEADHSTTALFTQISEKLRAGAPDPKIQLLIGAVTSADLQGFATILSGEASDIFSRQSQSVWAVQAQNYIESQFRFYGFNASRHFFRAGYSDNVIGNWPGVSEPNKLVLITAHYDSRGASSSSTTARAPGANDNGSGTTAILQIAKILNFYKPRFNFTIRLVVFSGEEQGLVGSAAYAQLIKSQGANVVAVLNADMIAYRRPTEIQQLAFPTGSSTPALNSLLGQIAKEYVPQLTIGTSSACCTDHASFYNQGFPAASYFERNGAIADPMYHNVGDLVFREGYDLPAQYPAITRAILAGAATIAQIVL